MRDYIVLYIRPGGVQQDLPLGLLTDINSFSLAFLKRIDVNWRCFILQTVFEKERSSWSRCYLNYKKLFDYGILVLCTFLQVYLGIYCVATPYENMMNLISNTCRKTWRLLWSLFNTYSRNAWKYSIIQQALANIKEGPIKVENFKISTPPKETIKFIWKI